jgi:adenylate cyclase
MKRCSLFAVLCLVCSLPTLTAQTPTLDSLQALLKTAKEDTAKVRLLNDIAFEQSDPAQYRATAERAYALAMRITDKNGAARAKIYIASAYNEQGSYAEALRAAEEALALARAAGNNRLEMRAYQALGNSQSEQGNFDAALGFFFKVLSLSEETVDKKVLVNTLLSMGNVYGEMGNQTSALEYYRKSLALSEELGDKQGASIAINNIGNVNLTQGKYDSALVYFRRALVIQMKVNDQLTVALCLLNIGESSLRLKRFSEAQSALEQALQRYTELGAKYYITYCLRCFSELSAAQGNYAEAVRYGVRAVALADSINTRPYKRDALKALSAAYAGMTGNATALTTALALYKDYIALRDSIVNDETTKKAAFREAKYAADKKDKEILLLKKDVENQALVRNSLLGGLSLVGVLVFVLVYSNNRRKQANALLQKQAVQIQLVNTELSEKNAIIEQERKELERSNLLLDKAHEESETLLLNILPAPIARRLKSGERAIADKFDSVTVLFADIVGFTNLSARTTPEKLVQGLNDIFGRFDALAKAYELEKIKTVGDAYMIAGGLPEKSAHHCERIAHFALAMQEVMKSEKLRASNGEHIQLRIGIHTGEVVAGVIGTSKFAYDLWGDTVNIAARMESHGEAGSIHCTDEVCNALGDTFVFEERGEIEVKGKGLMRTWFLTGTQPAQVQTTVDMRG